MTTPMPSSAVPDATNGEGYNPQQIEQLKNRSKDKEFAKKVVAWTKSSHMRCRNLRQTVERQWYINMAFYCSRQNISILPNATAGARLWTPPIPHYRSRPVINKIRPIVRKELAKLTAQKPSASVVPSTSEDRDLAAAQAAEQIWDSTYREKKLKPKFRNTVFWMLITGVGFMKQYWDPEKAASDGQIGDFCFENITPFHLFFPDLLCQDIEDQPYIIHLQTRSSDWVKMVYGMDVQPNVMEANDILNDSFLNLVGATDMNKSSVLVYEVWVKPNNVPFMPNGGMYTIVGEELVQFVEGNPYLHQQYPYTKVDYIPNGRFYGDSVVMDLVPVQREYNRTRGQIIENKNALGHTKLMAAEGSIDVTKINTEPGQAILYKLGFPPPQPVPPVPLPNYIPQEIDRLNMEFDDISGQHDVSKGQAPPGVTAATAISFLQEQDETMMSATFQSIEEAYEKIAYQTLCYVKQYWTTPRMVKVTGADQQFNVLSFQGSDLRSNTDIRIEAGSALPTSKAAKQALLMDLMSQGFVDPQKGLELMEVGGVQRLYDQLKIDSAQASRENMKMSSVTQDQMDQYLQTFVGPPDPMTGQPSLVDPNTGGPLADQAGQPIAPPIIVPVNSYDKHEVHIEVHNNYRKSQEFETLPPEVKNLFEEHVNQHLQAMGMMPGLEPGAQQQMMMQAGAAGPEGPNMGAGQGNEQPPVAPQGSENQPPIPGMGG